VQGGFDIRLLSESMLELIAHGHQFVDLGDDAVLFAVRQQCEGIEFILARFVSG
jgi:hypothetical protein